MLIHDKECYKCKEKQDIMISPILRHELC